VSDDKKDSSGSADATLEIEEKPRSDESVESKEDVVDDKFIEIVETFIKDVKSVESLESFWKENAKEFKRMKEGQEATYNGLLESFAKIKSELTKEENKDG
ncbi:MAG TPA: hypothetical protein DCM40_42860, partial [Maribacter sp.]|nr:hypothetical protein [Maribacter sp.]